MRLIFKNLYLQLDFYPYEVLSSWSQPFSLTSKYNSEFYYLFLWFSSSKKHTFYILYISFLCWFNTYLQHTFIVKALAKNIYIEWNLRNDLNLYHITPHLPKANIDSSTHPEYSCSKGLKTMQMYDLLFYANSQGKCRRLCQNLCLPYLIYGGSSISKRMQGGTVGRKKEIWFNDNANSNSFQLITAILGSFRIFVL